MRTPASRTCALIALALLFAAPPSHAALNAYLRLKGQTQGDIKGGVTQKGREGKIAVIAARHGIRLPIDGAGVPAAKRVHRPFVITKEADVSSPRLWTALVNNELIPQFELQFWTPSATGAEVQHYTIRLTNARIVDIEFKLPNTRLPEEMKLKEQEEVSFTYQKIEWIWTQGGLGATDNWVK